MIRAFFNEVLRSYFRAPKNDVRSDRTWMTGAANGPNITIKMTAVQSRSVTCRSFCVAVLYMYANREYPSTKKPRFPGAFLFEVLLLNVRQESHESGSLHCCLHSTLLLGGEAGSLASHYATVRIYELLEQIDVLIVHVLDIILSQNVCHMNVLERYIVRIYIVFRVINAGSCGRSCVLLTVIRRLFLLA